MSRKFKTPDMTLTEWADNRNTDLIIACAINAQATDVRPMQTIWSEPTDIELKNVKKAVREYLENEDFTPNPRDAYFWGGEALHIYSDIVRTRESLADIERTELKIEIFCFTLVFIGIGFLGLWAGLNHFSFINDLPEITLTNLWAMFNS